MATSIPGNETLPPAPEASAAAAGFPWWLALLLGLGIPLLLVSMSFLLPRGKRAGIVMLAIFTSAAIALLKLAGPTLRMLGRVLAPFVLIVQHWDQLTRDQQTLILLLVVGFVLSVSLIVYAFKRVVYTAWFPRLYREDSLGHRDYFGRRYLTKKNPDGSGYVTFFRYFRGGGPPWRMSRIVHAAEPEARGWTGLYTRVIPAARFMRTGLNQWNSEPLGSTLLQTTPPVRDEYVAWEDQDLRRKTTIAKHGAEGHLQTSREKHLQNKMDTTMVRLDWMERVEEDERAEQIHEPTDRAEILQRLATDGPTVTDDEGTAPAQDDADVPE